MRALNISLIVVSLFFVRALSGLDIAHAQSIDQISGKPRVIEGDLLQVGQTLVRLYAIDAPNKGQLCQGKTREYPCGTVATTGLMDLIATVDTITCYPKGNVIDGAVVAMCKDPQGFDLSQQMVYTGWALALPDADTLFHRIQEKAQKAKRGLWKGQVTPPWRWQPK